MAQAPVSPRPSRRKGYLTFEEFLALPEPERAEWVDGRLVEMAGVTAEHGSITVWLISCLTVFLDSHPLGRIFHDPFVMRQKPDSPGRAPDIIFVANEHLGRLRENFLDGPADLVVEVISPGSRGLDRGDKFYEYEAGGIPEYWLIDPERRVAEFYRLDRDGHYQPVPVEGGVFRSDVLAGFWMRVSWLWERPPVAGVLAQLEETGP
jgi:Uma2 family endonuclease